MKFVFAKDHIETKNINVVFQNESPLKQGEYVLKLAAKNTYRVFVNHQLMHYGPSRSAHGYLQVDELNISLLDRSNYISIEVVGHNVNSYYFADEHPLFGIELYLDNKLFKQTHDFECFLLNDRTVKIQRYSFQRDFAESYVQNVDRSLFYLGDKNVFPKLPVIQVEGPKLIERQTPYPNLKQITQLTCVEIGEWYLDDKKPIWTDRAIENISASYKGYKKEELEIRLSDDVSRLIYEKSQMSQTSMIKNNQYQIFDAGRTLTGFIKINVQVMKPTVFYIVFDEIDYQESNHKPTDGIYIDFARNDCSNIIRYDLQPGNYQLITFEPYSLRYMNMIVFEGEINTSTIDFIHYENDDIYRLKVKTEDQTINNIIKASQHTLSQNAVDVLTDCPSRERAGWLCDAWFSARAEQLMTGHNTIERNFLLNYALSPQSPYLPKGMIPMNYPSDPTDGIFIPNWALWYGVELYDYYLRTGDKSLAMQSLPKIQGLIDYFKVFENEIGLLEDLESWVFVEWSKANDFIKGVNIPSNMLYAYFFECIGKLYDDNAFLVKSENIKKVVLDISFNGEFFEDQLIRDEKNQLVKTHNITETCQYYAFFTHTASKETHQKLYDTLKNEFGYYRNEEKKYPHVYKSNAFIGNYLRLEILRRNNETNQVLKECKDYFSYMAKRTQTLWEHSFVYGSLNHGFASYAANLIIESLTGIKGYNEKMKTIIYKKPTVKLDFEVFIPFGSGIKVSRHKGILNMVIPSDINIIED